ncbi:hypothetical protein I3760_05G054100, partial [Carya illinoinensis]
GRVERLGRFGVTDRASPGQDPKTQVQSKDVVVCSDTGVSARIFLPKLNGPDQKLPLVVHYHGGGFWNGSPCKRTYHNFLVNLASEANAVTISVDYRLAPEHPLPIAYDDLSAALQWIAAHSNNQGPEPLLNEYADFGRVFLTGESAGANISHHVAVRAGVTRLTGLKIIGMLMVHPFFVGKDRDEMYKFLSSTSSGCSDDPKLNPAVDPDLSKMGCAKVLVCVAEKDSLKDRGVTYSETLKKSGWGGGVELIESKGEDHCFHLFNAESEQAAQLMKKFVEFVAGE